MIPQTAYDPPSELLPPGGGLTTHKKHIKDFPGTLDVVAVVSNPVRYRSRYDLYRAFERHILNAGARLTTVELAFARRPFEVTEAGNPRHVQLRTNHEYWHKENLINLGIASLPRDWQYVAWVDADLTFARPDIVQETLHQLQHYPIVQMWSHAQDLGPRYELVDSHVGFVYCYHHHRDVPMPGPECGPYGPHRQDNRSTYLHFWHPGYAWAARREAIDALGGLIDWAALGAADHHMSKALVGRVTEAVHPGIHRNYVGLLKQWQDRAERHIRRNVGYVEGTILHYFHGSKRKRMYWNRWKVLVDGGYDPLQDIKPDWQGVMQLIDHGTPRSIRLRDEIRSYFRQRDEDGSEV